MILERHDPAARFAPGAAPHRARLEALIGLAALVVVLMPGMPALEMSRGLIRIAAMAIPAALIDAITGLANRADIQLGAYAGPAYTPPSDVRLRQPNGTDLLFESVPWRGEPFKRPPYYGYRGSYWPGAKSFGLMLDFTHIKAKAVKSQIVGVKGMRDGTAVSGTEALAKTFQKLEFTHGYNLLTLNAVYRRASPGNRFGPYFGVGAGLSIPHVEILRAGWPKKTRTNEYQIAGPAFQFLAGVQWRLSAHISLFVEYKFSCTINTGRLTGGGTLAANLCSHQLLSGPAVHLSGATMASRRNM